MFVRSMVVVREARPWRAARNPGLKPLSCLLRLRGLKASSPSRQFHGPDGHCFFRIFLRLWLVEVRAAPGLKSETWGTPFRAGFGLCDVGQTPL